MAFLKDYDHLKIEIKDVALATNNFDPTNVIGVGGFGKVYKGELSHPDGRIAVAFKKLDRRMGQGKIEFWKEIMMLSKYKHENLISLMHFCMEGNEMILVYEYAARGSLDHHLGNTSLTWGQRLRICIGAARGLQFLHNPTNTHQRVIHRDIKSANILLDEKWTAKIADFGLSKAGPANQPQTYLITNAVGTPGYCDPLYWELGFLSKESDVYSFGVVLFEVLCGRLCFEYCNGALKEILVHKWRSRYVKNCLDEIIFLGLKEQMDPGSLNSFSAIAYRCVKKTREERPMMVEIVKELEFALEQQEIFENLQERVDFAELMPDALPSVSNGKRVDLEELLKIADLAVPPLLYGSQTQLFMFLRKGFLVDDGQTWISINMNLEVTEVISATKCIVADDRIPDKTEDVRCKFGYCFQKVFTGGFKVEVDTQFLTPRVTYIIYIVFKLSDSVFLRKGEKIPAEFGPLHIPITYKLDGETHYSKSCFGYVTAEGWQIVELYQFTSYQRQQNFSIDFLGSPARSRYYADDYAFEGIALRPVVNETCEKQEEKNKVDTDWGKKLPTYLIEFSKDVVHWTTEKELYFLLRKGFLVDNEMWFSINKNTKTRLMVSSSTFLRELEWKSMSIPEPESRFKMVAKSCYDDFFHIDLKIKSKILLPQTTYSCHLIYKIPDTSNYSQYKDPMVVYVIDDWGVGVIPSYICFNTHCHAPIISPKDDKISPYDPLDTYRIKGHSKLRKDGWMEIQIGQVTIPITGTIDQFFGLTTENDYKFEEGFFDIVIEGIEIRSL